MRDEPGMWHATTAAGMGTGMILERRKVRCRAMNADIVAAQVSKDVAVQFKQLASFELKCSHVSPLAARTKTPGTSEVRSPPFRSTVIMIPPTTSSHTLFTRPRLAAVLMKLKVRRRQVKDPQPLRSLLHSARTATPQPSLARFSKPRIHRVSVRAQSNGRSSRYRGRSASSTLKRSANDSLLNSVSAPWLATLFVAEFNALNW